MKFYADFRLQYRGSHLPQESLSYFSEVEMNLISKNSFSPIIIHPGNPEVRSIHIKGDLHSQGIQEVLHLLTHRLKRSLTIISMERTEKKDGVITITLNRKFSAPEMKEARWFGIEAQGSIGEIDIDLWHDLPAGTPTPFLKPSIKPKPFGNDTYYPHTQKLFCHQEVADELKTENFQGLVFQECQLTGNSKKQGRIFEISSSIQLPPTLNRFYAAGREPLPEHKYRTSGSCFFNDIAYPTQFCFPEGSLDQGPPFDLARTEETIGHADDKDPLKFRAPYLVVSARLRDKLKALKARITFTPVREGIPETVDLPEPPV